MKVPGGLRLNSLDVFVDISMLEVPQQNNSIRSQRHREGMQDSRMPPERVRIGSWVFFGLGVIGRAAPPAVLGVFETHKLLGIPEGDLDFPPTGEGLQDLFDRQVGVGAEVSPVFDTTSGVPGDGHSDEFCPGDCIPETLLGFDQDGSRFTVNGYLYFSPFADDIGGQFLGRRESLTSEPFPASARRLYGQVVKGGVHGHRANKGEGQIVFSQYGFASVFGVCHNGKGSVRRQPGQKQAEQFIGQLGAFSVLGRGTSFFGSVEPEGKGDGDAAGRSPGDRAPQGQHDPIVSEGKGFGGLRGSSGIGRSAGIVVHAATEDMGSGFLAHGIINNDNEILGKPEKGEAKGEQDMADSVCRPASLSQETIRQGVMAGRCRGLDDAADAVTALTGNPADHQSHKVLLTGLGEASQKCEQKGL